ncbi:MAG: hypothetical protein J7M40_01275 [Planctomycetes bacterium]|nr:hypothetical protein [Planctomycetota bacterium]
MDHDSLMGIALYVWEIRQAARAKALGRKALENAILELGDLREKVQTIHRFSKKSGERNLCVTIDSLFQLTEDDILDRLSAIPSSAYDLPQFAD